MDLTPGTIEAWGNLPIALAILLAVIVVVIALVYLKKLELTVERDQIIERARDQESDNELRSRELEFWTRLTTSLTSSQERNQILADTLLNVQTAIQKIVDGQQTMIQENTEAFRSASSAYVGMTVMIKDNYQSTQSMIESESKLTRDEIQLTQGRIVSNIVEENRKMTNEQKDELLETLQGVKAIIENIASKEDVANLVRMIAELSEKVSRITGEMPEAKEEKDKTEDETDTKTQE